MTMLFDMDALLGFCLKNIVCDSCRCNGAKLRNGEFTCDACDRWLKAAAAEQPKLFPSTTTEEEAPENP